MWKLQLARFRFFFSHLLLAIVLILSGSGNPGNATAQVNSAVNIVHTACIDTSCTYLPALLFTPVSPVKIVQERVHVDKAGGVSIRGEIQTVFDRPEFEALIEVRIFDEFDQLVEVHHGTPKFSATFPGQLNPFEISTSFRAVHELPFETEIIGWKLENPVTYAPLSTKIFPKESPPDGMVSEVTVRIENDGPVPLEDVQVMVWSLYQTYSILGQQITDLMLPGEVFTATQSFVYKEPLNSVHATAQGIIPGPAEMSPDF